MSDIREFIRAASGGNTKATVAIRGGRLVNVVSEEIYPLTSPSITIALSLSVISVTILDRQRISSTRPGSISRPV